MIKFYFTIIITFLIFSTTVVKNITKKLNNKIYSTNERISLHQNKLNVLKLEFDYLTSPEQLMKYQKLYFDEELKPIRANEIGILNANSGKFLNKKNIISYE